MIKRSLSYFLFLLPILFGHISATLAAKKDLPNCIYQVATIGVESYFTRNSPFAKDQRIATLIRAIESDAPDIDGYAQNFFNSNGTWPSMAQVKSHLLKRFRKMHDNLLLLMRATDFDTTKKLDQVRKTLRGKIKLLYESFDPVPDSRIFRIGDGDLKYELIAFDLRFRGELSEVEAWYRTERPIAFNFHFKNSPLSAHPKTQVFQLRLARLKDEVAVMPPQQVRGLKNMAHPEVFNELSNIEKIRSRMIELLSYKEIDIVAQESDGSLLFLEVKNYQAPLLDIASTQYSKKSILKQMEETRWILDALGMSEEVKLGIVFLGTPLHPMAARELLSRDFKVYVK